MAKSKDLKGKGTSSKSSQNSTRNASNTTTKGKVTSSVRPDDNERRDGPGGN